MTEQGNPPAVVARQRNDARRDTVALIALCSLFAVLDVIGVIYIMVKGLGQQVTIMITFGGVVVLVMFVALIYYVLVNPVYGQSRASTAPRSGRAR